MSVTWGCTIAGVALAGCGAYAIAVITCGSARAAADRARWAWRCRKPPARTEGKLTRAEYRTFVGLVETWRQSGAPERSRT